VMLEAGWMTTASEFPDQASEANQARHYADLKPWKGDPNDANGAEKHWGLFRVDRTPKLFMEQ
jgi:hypothetical protein